MSAVIENLCVIGTGLIGGSLCLALKEVGACKHITGAGRSEQTLLKAKQLDIIDDYATDISAAVEDADMVVVSVPLGAMSRVFEQIASGLERSGNENAVITDAGSAKAQVQQLADKIFAAKGHRFVAGHPIAGTEKSGPEAAFADLYKDRRVILTPTDSTDPDAIERVTSMWQRVGARVETMSAEHHDKVLAATSHLPHMMAFGLVHCLENMDDIEDVFRFAAGGFRDISRIASSDPVMWRDICLENRQAVLTMMDRFTEDFARIRAAIEAGQGDELLEIFSRAKQARDEHAE